MTKVSKRKKLLSSSRPTATAPKNGSKTLSSTQTRSIIRSLHTLNKQLAQAIADGDHSSEAQIRGAIASSGGLEAYQRASIQGQNKDRGGDTSHVLVKWMHEIYSSDDAIALLKTNPLRMLEIGCLSPDNACAKSKLFTLERIDLNSQHPLIQTQDFMERPIPATGTQGDGQRFDAISLSLVLNYVPDAVGRGAMLKRLSDFLLENGQHANGAGLPAQAYPPYLFFVLPAPCVENSRYLTDEHLASMMTLLGYTLLKKKLSAKLIYLLYSWRRDDVSPNLAAGKLFFPKQELRKGASRNNFTIVL